MIKKRMLIADDHRLFLDGLESILSSVFALNKQECQEKRDRGLDPALRTMGAPVH